MVLSQLLVLVPAVVLGAFVDVSVATSVPHGDTARTGNAAVGAVAESRSVVKRSFLQSCLGPDPGGFTLSSGHILNGSCRNTSGGWNFHSANLNLCITNTNGQLQWLAK